MKAELKTALKVTLFRMWAAGSVCFFAAWGRAGPTGDTMENVGDAFSFNLIGGLIAIMVLADIVIVNPVIRLASGKRVFGEEKKGAMFVLSMPLHIIKVTSIMLLIVGTYFLLNTFFIRVYSLDTQHVPVPLEPFLFGFLYGLYYFVFDIVIKFIKEKLFTKKIISNKENI